MNKAYIVADFHQFSMICLPQFADMANCDFDGKVSVEDDALDRLGSEYNYDTSESIFLQLQGHNQHDQVIALDEWLPGRYRADGIMAPNYGKNRLLPGIVGDCPILVFYSPAMIGELHAGMPEMQAGATEVFLTKWLERVPAKETKIIIGPHIRVEHYEWGPTIQPELEQFIVNNDGQNYFDITRALMSKLTNHGVPTENILDSKFDSYLMAKTGIGSSYRFHKNNPGTPNYRDCFITIIKRAA